MSKKTDTQPAVSAPSGAAIAPRKTTAKADTTEAVHHPDMDALVKTDTVAESMELMFYQGKSGSVAPSELAQFDEEAEPIRAAMKDAARHEKRSRSAHARSIGLAHPLVRSLCEQPELLWAMIERNGDKVTERTAKSPCLPAIKALYPNLDRREQSALAQIHNYALACGWTGDELQREVQSVGSVELVKRERQRQRLRAGAPGAPSDEEIIAGYRGQATASPPADVRPPKNPPVLGLAVAIVEFIDDHLVIYDIDDDARRVLAVVKHCAKRGRELRVRPAAVDVPEAAE